MPQGPTDPLAWLSVAVFVLAGVVAWYDRDLARRVGAGAWAVFAAFWLALVPHFAFAQLSIVEGVLSAVAVPACLYTGYLLYRGRESLLVATRAVAVMGLIYMSASTITWIHGPLVELTTRQIEWSMAALGYTPEVTTGERGLRNTFVFATGGNIYRTRIVFACTGLGSMAIFAGLIAAVRAPLRRKLRALVVSISIIWVLNIIRNVFIALAQGKQWFRDFYPEVVMTIFGTSNPHLVSFLWADRIFAQSLSVVALVGITLIVVRELPELSSVIEDVLFLLTGREIDAREEFGIGVRADGGEQN